MSIFVWYNLFIIIYRHYEPFRIDTFIDKYDIKYQIIKSQTGNYDIIPNFSIKSFIHELQQQHHMEPPIGITKYLNGENALCFFASNYKDGVQRFQNPNRSTS